MSKKQKRNEYSIGKEYFEFDYTKEKNMYCFLWGIKTHKKEIKELADNEKIEHYSDWKKYIYEKYKEYSVEKLEEFSRFLGQRIRNLKPYVEIWNMAIPIMLALLVNVVFDLLVELTMINPQSDAALTLSSFAGMLIIFVVVFEIIFVAYVGLLSKIATPLWDNTTEENLLTDYKEIIDKMIKEKTVKKKETKKKCKS